MAGSFENKNKNYSPPSSVITETVVAGPWPAGLNTSNETKYCVYVSKCCILWFCNKEKGAEILEQMYGRNNGGIKTLSYFNGRITYVYVLFFHVRFYSRFITDSITQKFALNGVWTGRLPCQINGRRWSVVSAGNYWFSFRRWNKK